MKFDGINWVNVGEAHFSKNPAYFTSLAFSPSGQPYVAYNGGDHMQVTVKKFDGSNWVYVGNAGFSAGYVDRTSIALNTNGQLYVAFSDYANSYKATALTYDFPAIINENQESGFSVYPNPAADKITIETNALPTKSQLSIMNVDGQQLITRQITEPKTQLDISNLPSGVYFVRVQVDKTVQVGKIIKQ